MPREQTQKQLEKGRGWVRLDLVLLENNSMGEKGHLV